MEYTTGAMSHPTNAYRGEGHRGAPAIKTSLACAIFTHLVLFITIFLAFVFVFNWPNPNEGKINAWKFQWHPICMISAFVLFMGEALMAYRLLPFEHNTQKGIHLTLQTIALTLASVGLWAMLSFHKENSYADFYNIHEITGITAFVLFCVQYTLGVTAFVFPRFSDGPRGAILPYHKYIGIVLFLLTWFAMMTGLMNRVRLQFAAAGPFFTPEWRTSNALGAFIILSGCCIVFHFSPAAQKKEHPETERLL